MQGRNHTAWKQNPTITIMFHESIAILLKNAPFFEVPLYLAAQAANPRRWSRNTRNWTPIGAVTLNPENPELIKTQAFDQTKHPIKTNRQSLHNSWDNYLEMRRLRISGLLSSNLAPGRESSCGQPNPNRRVVGGLSSSVAVGDPVLKKMKHRSFY
jgi:hypothetical protein